MILVVIIWSAVFPLGKMILNSISPYSFIFFRGIISGVICLLPIIFSCKKIKPIEWKLTAASAFCFTITMTSLAKAVSYIDSSLSAFIFSTSIVFVTAIECILQRKKPRINQIIGTIICILGSLLMVENLEFEIHNIKGILWCLSGTLSSSLSIIIVSKLSRKSEGSSIRNAFLQNVFCFIFCFLFIKDGLNDIPNINIEVTSIILYCAIASSIISIIMQFYAQKKISSQSAVIIIMLEPLFAAIISFFFLREDIFTLKFISGAILIMLSLIFTSMNVKKKQKYDLHS